MSPLKEHLLIKKPNIKALQPYIEAGYDLIPLHSGNKVMTDSRTGKKIPRGKTPRDKNWRRKKYSLKQIMRHIEGGGNIGVRLRKTDLVLDVDPRNFPDGDDVLSRFAENLGINLDRYPKVRTGGGGWHFYMTKPEDMHICETLKEYPGLEFKTFGRQVVAAGSVHPNGKLYKWN